MARLSPGTTAWNRVPICCYTMSMDRLTALARLKSCEAELRALGVQSLSLFGSTARNEANDVSDVDVAVVLDNIRGGFQFLGLLDHIRDELTQRLGVPVDVVPDPTHPNRIKKSIDKDRAIVFEKSSAAV